ncbi:DUF1648 domain-containing protein [Compostibacter hankyongensis]|uniref:DUF1648 domain-containing protein n=1 Tax=Compostibacter hankyongensis TaxID=1007089 RepID=UPI0031EEFDC9
MKSMLSSADRAAEISGWVILAGLWILTLWSYPGLPDIIPVHYSGTGQVDGYGSKSALLILAAIGTFLFIGMTILTRYPFIFNHPTGITETNKVGQRTGAIKLIRYLKLLVVLVFTIIVYSTLQIVSGKSGGLRIWFLPLIEGLIFVPVVYFVIRSLRTRPRSRQSR